MERVVAGLQQRRVVTEKEKRILAYHEAGHALMSHLMGDPLPGPEGDDRLARPGARLHAQPARARIATCTRREELVDMMKVYLAGRAAEQIVFGRVTNGAANDLEKRDASWRARWSSSTAWARSSPRGRCAPTTTRSRRRRSGCATPSRRGSPTTAYEEALRLLQKHRAVARPRRQALLEKETLDRDELRAARRRRAGVAARARRSAPSALLAADG